jgi:uncharacterized protein (TIGR03435 family)
MIESRRNSASLIGLLVLAIAIFSQSAAAQTCAESPARNEPSGSPRFEFEVASVKLNSSGRGNGMRETADEYIATNVTVLMLIQSLCGIYTNDRYWQVPNWLNSERYDVEAKMDAATAAALQTLSAEQRTLARKNMVQAVLADRFGLRMHREVRELPLYSLFIARNGLKLPESKPNGSKWPIWRIMKENGGAMVSLNAQQMPIESLAGELSSLLGRPVQDKTGLTGKYDLKLEFAADDVRPDIVRGMASSEAKPNDTASGVEPVQSGPSLFIALEQQLGLKLESGKGPVEVIVIDHIERPSEN